VKVFNRQQVGGTLCEPRRPVGALALRAMVIAAGAIGDRAMATLVALVDVAAERGHVAEHNILQSAFLLNAERIPKSGQIGGTMAVKNIGQLQRWRHYAAGTGSTGQAKRSSGLMVDRIARLMIWTQTISSRSKSQTT
jgi:hypothetical protein